MINRCMTMTMAVDGMGMSMSMSMEDKIADSFTPKNEMNC